ncbi:MAG: hypothetical protein GY715_10535 [Planctomycetes bacterium]|nr:hypothetical protein [Planctomycetota bacterium]
MPSEPPTEPGGKRVTVMGLGRFGGGLGVTRWLAGRGAEVLVTDSADAASLERPVAQLADLVAAGSVRLRLGEHVERDFTDCDLVVASPAVVRPWENSLLAAAAVAGVPVTTEIRLLVERLDRRRVIGVTGTAGKSTTSAMIHHLLDRAGHRAHLGGNIGGSLLADLDSIRDGDWVVLELSSFMLHWLASSPDAEGWSPRIAVLTNLAPNHLDWHGTYDHYAVSKQQIFRDQRDGDHAVRGDAIVTGATLPLGIPGLHNQHNGHVAIAVARHAIDLDTDAAAARLADFPGLPHRLELVGEDGSGRWYNDSKSTTPRATVLAVEAFDEPDRVHLIAGGFDKGLDLSSIAELCPRLAGLYAIGATGATIVARAADTDRARSCETLDRAVATARDRMRPGDVLLLSPGCASWDQFTNYEERGEAFRALVNG